MQSSSGLKRLRFSSRTLSSFGTLLGPTAHRARGYKAAQETRQEAAGFEQSESTASTPPWLERTPRAPNEAPKPPLEGLIDTAFQETTEPQTQTPWDQSPQNVYPTQAKIEEILPGRSPSETSFWKHVLPENYLRVRLDNGKVQRFDPVFLRDSCQCRLCVDEHSGQKKFDTTAIPTDIRIRKTTGPHDGSFSVYWENDVKGFSDSHQTKLPPLWFTQQTQPELRDPAPTVRPWNRAYMSTALKHIDFHQYMNRDLYDRTLKALYKYGLVIIKNVPEDPTAVERIGEMIGPLRHTFYGRTWDVKDKPKAENVAYTSGFLGLHMDLLYMKNPPGLQLLHCIKAAGAGGESIFSDAFAAAANLKLTAPEAFHDLATFPVTYHYTKGGHHFMDHKPVIQLDEHDADKIAHVNWSPPFQGPFTIDKGLGDNGRALRNWHRAARAFDRVLNVEGNLLEYRLKEGDCVVFDNRRVLHGRKAFTSAPVSADGNPDTDAVRWLKGAYLDHDDFRSQIRGMMQRSQGTQGEKRKNDIVYERLRTEEREKGSEEVPDEQ